MASTTFFPTFLSQHQALVILHSRVRACPTGFFFFFKDRPYSCLSGSSLPIVDLKLQLRSVSQLGRDPLHKFQLKQDVSPPGEMSEHTWVVTEVNEK